MPKPWSLPVFTGLKNLYQFSQWSNAKTNVTVQEFPSEDRKKLYVTWFALKSLDVRFWPCAGVDAMRIFILKGARHRMKVSHPKRIYVLWFPLFCSHHHTLAYTKTLLICWTKNMFYFLLGRALCVDIHREQHQQANQHLGEVLFLRPHDWSLRGWSHKKAQHAEHGNEAPKLELN